MSLLGGITVRTATISICVFWAATAASAQTFPTGKFAAYGGPSDAISTELHGTVKWITGATGFFYDLFVSPDSGYQHLLITGNQIQPSSDEYDPSQFPGLATGFVPVIKIETTGVNTRPESNPSQTQILVHLPGGGTRPVQVGDHISLTGLWAIDYSHTMYSDLCTHSFSYPRGAFVGCHAHAEIHPLDINSVALIPFIPAVGTVYTENHLMGAPVYWDYYSDTYEVNKLGGIAGWFVTDSARTSWEVDSVISPPQFPLACPNCQVAVSSLSTTTGTGTFASNYAYNQDESVNLHMTTTGTNVFAPAILNTAVSMSVSNCSVSACACLPQPKCIDQAPSAAFCGAKVNCSGKCNIVPGEPGTRICEPPNTFGQDPICKCQ